MIRLQESKILQRFASVLVFFFALQVLVALPAHNLHGAEKVSQQSAQKASDEDTDSSSPDGHCDFFLAFCNLDSGSVAEPPVLGLELARQTIVLTASDSPYLQPTYSFLARGPPAILSA